MLLRKTVLAALRKKADVQDPVSIPDNLEAGKNFFLKSFLKYDKDTNSFNIDAKEAKSYFVELNGPNYQGTSDSLTELADLIIDTNDVYQGTTDPVDPNLVSAIDVFPSLYSSLFAVSKSLINFNKTLSKDLSERSSEDSAKSQRLENEFKNALSNIQAALQKLRNLVGSSTKQVPSDEAQRLVDRGITFFKDHLFTYDQNGRIKLAADQARKLLIQVKAKFASKSFKQEEINEFTANLSLLESLFQNLATMNLQSDRYSTFKRRIKNDIEIISKKSLSFFELIAASGLNAKDPEYDDFNTSRQIRACLREIVVARENINDAFDYLYSQVRLDNAAEIPFNVFKGNSKSELEALNEEIDAEVAQGTDRKAVIRRKGKETLTSILIQGTLFEAKAFFTYAYENEISIESARKIYVQYLRKIFEPMCGSWSLEDIEEKLRLVEYVLSANPDEKQYPDEFYQEVKKALEVARAQWIECQEVLTSSLDIDSEESEILNLYYSLHNTQSTLIAAFSNPSVVKYCLRGNAEFRRLSNVDEVSTLQNWRATNAVIGYKFERDLYQESKKERAITLNANLSSAFKSLISFIVKAAAQNVNSSTVEDVETQSLNGQIEPIVYRNLISEFGRLRADIYSILKIGLPIFDKNDIESTISPDTTESVKVTDLINDLENSYIDPLVLTIREVITRKIEDGTSTENIDKIVQRIIKRIKQSTGYVVQDSTGVSIKTVQGTLSSVLEPEALNLVLRKSEDTLNIPFSMKFDKKADQEDEQKTEKLCSELFQQVAKNLTPIYSTLKNEIFELYGVKTKEKEEREFCEQVFLSSYINVLNKAMNKFKVRGFSDSPFRVNMFLPYFMSRGFRGALQQDFAREITTNPISVADYKRNKELADFVIAVDTFFPEFNLSEKSYDSVEVLEQSLPTKTQIADLFTNRYYLNISELDNSQFEKLGLEEKQLIKFYNLDDSSLFKFLSKLIIFLKEQLPKAVSVATLYDSTQDDSQLKDYDEADNIEGTYRSESQADLVEDDTDLLDSVINMQTAEAKADTISEVLRQQEREKASRLAKSFCDVVEIKFKNLYEQLDQGDEKAEAELVQLTGSSTPREYQERLLSQSTKEVVAATLLEIIDRGQTLTEIQLKIAEKEKVNLIFRIYMKALRTLTPSDKEKARLVLRPSRTTEIEAKMLGLYERILEDDKALTRIATRSLINYYPQAREELGTQLFEKVVSEIELHIKNHIQGCLELRRVYVEQSSLPVSLREELNLSDFESQREFLLGISQAIMEYNQRATDVAKEVPQFDKKLEFDERQEKSSLDSWIESELFKRFKVWEPSSKVINVFNQIKTDIENKEKTDKIKQEDFVEFKNEFLSNQESLTIQTELFTNNLLSLLRIKTIELVTLLKQKENSVKSLVIDFVDKLLKELNILKPKIQRSKDETPVVENKQTNTVTTKEVSLVDSPESVFIDIITTEMFNDNRVTDLLNSLEDRISKTTTEVLLSKLRGESDDKQKIVNVQAVVKRRLKDSLTVSVKRALKDFRDNLKEAAANNSLPEDISELIEKRIVLIKTDYIRENPELKSLWEKEERIAFGNQLNEYFKDIISKLINSKKVTVQAQRLHKMRRFAILEPKKAFISPVEKLLFILNAA